MTPWADGKVSASCNEMSIGMDYSVELSTELDEKCDFVEVVRPVAKRGLAGMGVASTGVGTIEEAAEEAEEPREKSEKTERPKEELSEASQKPAPAIVPDALDALMPKSEAKAKGGDALDSLISSTTKPSTVVNPSPKATEMAKAEEKDKEDDEYADASFDGSMSVPESINEEAGSGSDAWGSEEDV